MLNTRGGDELTAKLSKAQTELVQWLASNRYELRLAHWQGRLCAYIYDHNTMSYDDWPVRVTTVLALEQKGIIEQIGKDRLTGDIRFHVVEREP